MDREHSMQPYKEFNTNPMNNKSLYQYICQILLVATLLVNAGCSKRYSDVPAFSAIPFKDYPNESVGRFKSSYLADQIDAYYRGTDPGPIGVTTFVNLDDLYSSSTFGRVYAEQLMSELAMRGYEVVELRHADALQFLNNTGEFALSRDVSSVRRERTLGGVIVGTYVVSPVRVYVNSRLIDPNSSVILSAGSVEMEKTPEIARLARGGGVVTAMERIPVKHIGLASYPATLFPNNLNRVYELEESEPVSPRIPSIRRK